METAAAHSLCRTASRPWRDDPVAHRAACLAILLIALAIRIWHVNQPMRLDESRTVLDYALRPVGEALSNYRLPNNHVFHTLLVWVSIRLFGHAEWAVRLPALIGGILIVPATYVAARGLADRTAALFAAALAAVLPILILYSTNARGYGMLCLAFLILIPLADALADKESPARWAAFVLLVAAGAFTIPVMLYPAGAVSIWLLLERARRQGTAAAIRFGPRLATALAVAAALAALAYLPAILRYGVRSLVSNRFVAALTWRQFFRALPGFAYRVRTTIGLGIPRWFLLGLILVGVLPLIARWPGRTKLRNLAGAVGLWCIVLLVVTRHPPPGRVWLFLAPLLCLYVGTGLGQATAWLSRGFRARGEPLAMAALLTLTVGIGGYTVARRTVFESDETVTLVAGKAIATFLLAEAHPDDRVVVIQSTGPQVDYYLFTIAGRRLVELESPSRTGRLLVILNERDAQTIGQVRRQRTDLKWGEFEAPVLVRQLEAASIYEARHVP